MKTQNDDWITIKPNGEENKGRHLLVKEGETPKEAIKRTYGVDLDKKKAPSAKDEWKRKAEEQNKTSAYKQTAVEYATGEIMPHTSKSGLKKAGLKSKQIEELVAEGDDITKKIREIIGSEKTDDEKLDALAGLKERSDALKKKVEEYSAQGAISRQEKAAKEETAKKSVKGFEITQETPKAYLITKDGRQAWIQKKWLKDDGTLTPAAESAVAKGQKTADIARENAEREKGLELPAKPDWESAKAVAYDVDVGIDHSHYSERDEETVGGIEHVKHRIFIPKSMIKGGRVPTWLMEKKIEEAEQQYFSERGGHTMSRGHISDLFGKKVYTEGGRSKIAFTKEKADYLEHRYDDLVENRAIRIGNCLICKVKNKFVTIYNDRWITVKPNGEEHKGRHLLLEGGESPREAIARKWKKKPTNTPTETGSETATKPAETTKETIAETETPKNYKERYKDFFDKYDADVANYEKRRHELIEKAAAEAKNLPEGSAEQKRAQKELHRLVMTHPTTNRYLRAYIKERSTNIKQDLEKYSSKTDDLVKSLGTIEDTPAEKELQGKLDKIKKRKEELYGSKDKEALGELWALQTQEVFLKQDLEKETSNAKAEQVIKVLNKKDTNFKLKYNTKPSTKEIASKLDDALSGFIGEGIVPENAVVDIRRTSSAREFETSGSINFNKNTNLPIAIHEYMHFVEEKNPRILANSLAFAKMRTEGEKTQSLKRLTRLHGYHNGENAKPDHFFSPYCGKTYSDDGTYENAKASEIMSMGLEQIVTNPKKFAEEDREYFNFVIANIKGDI